LCFAACRLLRSRSAATIAVVGFVALAVQPRFALWNTQILSESLSLSMAMVTIAALWWAASERSLTALRWSVASTAVWMMVRDANPIGAVIAIAPILILVSRFPRGVPRAAAQRSAIGGVLVLAAALVVVLGGQRISNRDQYPIHDNVGMRILPNPDLTRFFVA